MKIKRSLLKLLVFLAVISGLAWGQGWLTGVAAKVSAYLVRFPNELDFGVVFPEETLSRNYEISFTNDIGTEIEFEYPVDKTVGEEYDETVTVIHGDSIKYGITEGRKELPEGYGGGGDPALPGYYRDLCPHVGSTNGEGEGDVETAALLSATDGLDSWILDLLVPPIDGYVPPEEMGLVETVPVADDYGCDLAVGELGQTTTLRVDLPEDCVEFVSATPGLAAYDSGGEILTWNFSEVYYGDELSVEFKVRGKATCSATTTGVAYDDGIQVTTIDGVEDIIEEGETLGAAVGGDILGLATGGNLIYTTLASLAMIFVGLRLRRRLRLAPQD